MQRCVYDAKHKPSEPTSLHFLLAACERKLEITDMWGENVNADEFIEVRNGKKGFWSEGDVHPKAVLFPYGQLSEWRALVFCSTPGNWLGSKKLGQFVFHLHPLLSQRFHPGQHQRHHLLSSALQLVPLLGSYPNSSGFQNTPLNPFSELPILLPPVRCEDMHCDLLLKSHFAMAARESCGICAHITN